MTKIIIQWEKLDEKVAELEILASKMAEEKVELGLMPKSYAYNREEISNIFDKAPAGKKIATLAKHLGVDAKRAFQILKQDQAQVEADAWNEAGDTFKKLENSAIVIKDGCKVAGFVGGVVLSGGTSAIATGSVLTKAAVVVSGADLVLEVTEDGANIALGNDNKIAAIASEARKVTGPIATVLTITDIPNNLKTGFEKFNAVMVGLEQFRGVAQEGQVLGVSLPVYNPKEKNLPVQVSALDPKEIQEWLKENKAEMKNESKNEIEKVLGIEDFAEGDEEKTRSEESQKTEVESIATGNNEESIKSDETQEDESSKTEQSAETTDTMPIKKIAGNYSASAILQHIEEDVESPDSLPVTLELNENGTGTVNVNGYGGEASYTGNAVVFSVTMKEDGAVVHASFEGKMTSNGNQTTISGNMYFSMMGVTFASYSWSAQK